MRRQPFRTLEGRAIAALVAVGLVARAVRYLACFPLWEAEAYAAATLVSRRFGDLARPLDYQTVCPVGFLWLEGLAVGAFGPSEYALRAAPLLFGAAALVLFAWAAGRALAGSARVLAVGLLAVAYQSIRQSAECRQYASDLFFAVLLVALTVGFLEARPERRIAWRAGLAASLPVAVLFSLTSLFVAAGAVLAVGWTDALAPEEAEKAGDRSGRWLRLLPAGALAAAAAVSLAVLWVLQLSAIHAAVRSAGALHIAWQEGFPPLSDPGGLWVWLLVTHTGRMFAYPFGARALGSLATTVLFVVGLAEARRLRETGLLLLVGAPFLAGLAAAGLHLYPYGETDRLVVYLAPGICLMAGLGAGKLLESSCREQTRLRVLRGIVGALVVAGLAVCADSLWRPYSRVEDDRERRFARTFWREVGAGAEAASARDDLGVSLEPERWLWSPTGYAAAFRYYRALYGPKPWRSGDERWGLLRADHPLRAVAWSQRAEPALEREREWLDSIAARYELRRRQDLSVNGLSHYFVYELAPVGPAASPVSRFPPLTGGDAQ